MGKRILFNALAYSPPLAVSGGISRYVYELAKELALLRGDVTVAVQEQAAESLSIPPGQTICCPNARDSRRRILMEQFLLPVRACRFSLAHYPDCAVPIARPWPVVATCHDLIFLTQPGTFTRSQTLWKRWMARRAARRAACIVCDSQHTAADLRESLHVPEERTRVIYPGVRACAGPAQRPTAALPETPFILSVGRLLPIKNYVRLIEALRILRNKGVDLSLVIAGKKGWLFEDIFEKVRATALQGRIFVLGYCRDDELKWLYEHAAVLAYVSLYEGFGFPPLEAMARGLPVVASKAGSIPEVCGGAAHYVDPLSADAIAAGIERVVSDDSLRQELTRRGDERVRQFQWDRTARAISAVYDELL